MPDALLPEGWNANCPQPCSWLQTDLKGLDAKEDQQKGGRNVIKGQG